MGRWIGILLAETGSSTDPGALHYDYIDVEMTASVIQAAKQTFWWETFPVLLRISICMLTPVPTQLIKIHLPHWTCKVFQHHIMLDVFMIMVLASCKCSVKDTDTPTLLTFLLLFAVSFLIKCCILIFYFAWSLRNIPGTEQICWNMQLHSSCLSVGCICCTYSQHIQHIWANICCMLKMYDKFKSWNAIFSVFPFWVIYD